MHLPRWSRAFAGERKDHRFYELIEDTLKDGFSYGYFVVDDGADITPLSRVSCIKLGRLLSISFSRNAASYFPRPTPRSQTTMSITAPTISGRTIIC